MHYHVDIYTGAATIFGQRSFENTDIANDWWRAWKKEYKRNTGFTPSRTIYTCNQTHKEQ